MLILKVRNIARGFFNWITGRERKLSAARMRVCETCSQNDDGVCSICYCVLKAKTSEPTEECPLNKWAK